MTIYMYQEKPQPDITLNIEILSLEISKEMRHYILINRFYSLR